MVRNFVGRDFFIGSDRLKLIVAGVGPGDPDMVTAGALRAIDEADLVLIPHSRDGRPSVAAAALRGHLRESAAVPVVFPMVRDASVRDAALRERLEELRPRWESAETVVLPVIGDSALYATGAYLYEVWRGLVPGLELRLVPGVSAHSLAASCARRFLALGEDVLCVIPGTAEPARIETALRAADAAALYKPSALGEGLRPLVLGAGPWRETVRVDRAGLPDESVLYGDPALDPAGEYLSVLLLWR